MGNPKERFIKSPELNKQAVNRILHNLYPKNGEWKKCKECGGLWNKLTETGICIDCEERCHEC